MHTHTHTLTYKHTHSHTHTLTHTHTHSYTHTHSHTFLTASKRIHPLNTFAVELLTSLIVEIFIYYTVVIFYCFYEQLLLLKFSI